MSTVIYLHGLASSPLSVKGLFFQPRLEKLGFAVEMPDLNAPEFSSLTVSRAVEQTLGLIDRVDDAGRPLVLMGSSFGALVCAIAVGRRSERVAALVLMAPAFDMPGLWQRQLGGEGIEVWKKEGYIPIEHPAYELPQPLKYGFYQDAVRVDTSPPRLSHPCLVFHGIHDDVVDPELARGFGELNPQAVVHMLDDGHDLLETQEVMAGEVETFLKKEVLKESGGE